MEPHLRILLLCVLYCPIEHGLAQQITFSEHISPIIYEHCTGCHRPGEIGPMSLTSYQEVAAWANMIRYVTEIRYMPPWTADPSYRHFLGENTLTDADIHLIGDWVDGGSVQGDPMQEAPLPAFPTGSLLGQADTIISLEEAWLHAGNNEDDYRCFVIPTQYTEDKDIAAVEFRPGNTNIVHHALFAIDEQQASAAPDAADSTYGYPCFGGFGFMPSGTFVSYTPGQIPILYPDGIGDRLPAGADVVFQIHYAPTAVPSTDSSSLLLFFSPEPVDRYVDGFVAASAIDFMLLNGPFVLQPEEVKTFHLVRIAHMDMSLLTVYPHMHLLGTDIEIYAVTPSGDTIPLINIPEWDFNWQRSYNFDRMVKIPQGSVIHYFGTYDNSSNNPFNPNDPPQLVQWGERTQDEMMLIGMRYVPYQEGDEWIPLGDDSSTSSEQLISLSHSLFQSWPNPSSGSLSLGFELGFPDEVSLNIQDLLGRRVWTLLDRTPMGSGHHQLDLQTLELTAGIYLYRLSTKSGFQASRRLLVGKK
ncbi:MAG: T9SS type A sorting domain-containing protein [Bacteroidota bacterium]